MAEHYWPRKTGPIIFAAIRPYINPMSRKRRYGLSEEDTAVESLICVPQVDADRALDEKDAEIERLKVILRDEVSYRATRRETIGQDTG